jgi:hypothetical protein
VFEEAAGVAAAAAENDEPEVPVVLVVLAVAVDPELLAVDVAVDGATAMLDAVWLPAINAARPATPMTLATPVTMRARRAGWGRRRRRAGTGFDGMNPCSCRHLRATLEGAA